MADDVIKIVVSNTTEILSHLERNEDMRYALALLPDLATKFRAMADLNETPENRWISFILFEQLRLVVSAYDGKPDEWYKLNEKNISQLKGILKQFFEKVSVGLSKKDYSGIIDAAKDFFFEFHKLNRATTRVASD